MTATTIRPATVDDANALATTLDRAFFADRVSMWIFPNESDRRRLHPRFMRIFVDLALRTGIVETTVDLTAAALWLHIDPDHAASDEDSQHHRRMRESVGEPAASRFATLDALMANHHPVEEAHAYLAFLAVAPERQGQGLGGRLVGHRLERFDASATPAYLEASSPRNARLYRRLGFIPRTPTLDLPAGPSLYPMWRPHGALSQRPAPV
jgi:ribosomal protein S18 acetylase RimI-like enzyme